MRAGRLALAAVASLALLPGVASAHQVGLDRFEAPLPLSLLFVGAGATVGATAVALAASGYRVGTADRRLVTVGPAATSALAWTARVGFLALVAAAVVAGLVGPQVRAENLATVFVWPVWLRGVAIVAILVGSPWPVLSPWRTVYEALVGLEGREIAVLGGYPDRLAEWPALAFFLVGIGVLENLTVVPRSPRLTAAVVAAYALVMLLGGLCYGRTWFERADALAVLYRLLGRVSPVDAARSADGGLRVGLHGPWSGAAVPVRSLAAVAFVVATVYTVSFDGFASTPEYQTLLFDAVDVLGTGPTTSVPLYLAGYAGFLAAFAVVVAATRRLGTPGTHAETARALAPTVLPIAAAYELAHNYPYVFREAGQLGTVAGDALGWHVHAPDPLWWLSVPAFWWSQVALIVGGHLVAVVAAHAVTSRRAEGGSADRTPTESADGGDEGRSVGSSLGGTVGRTHVPLTLLMVGYTVASLWIVSRPVVA